MDVRFAQLRINKNSARAPAGLPQVLVPILPPAKRGNLWKCRFVTMHKVMNSGERWNRELTTPYILPWKYPKVAVLPHDGLHHRVELRAPAIPGVKGAP